MSTKGIVVIDQGTTSTRTILFNLKGEILITEQEEFKQIYPKNGWVEHSPDDIFKTVLSTLTRVIKKANDLDIIIIGIGITNQRETTVLWDRKSGNPIHNAIVWQDRRTADLCDDLKLDGNENLIIDKTGLLLDPYFSATKISYILDNTEGAREKARQGRICFGTIDTYILYKLTEGKSYLTDATNASRTSLLNIHSCQWDEDLLALFNVPKDILPEVCNSSHNFGTTSKALLGYSIPIFSLIGDQQSAAIGQSCIQPGSLKSTYGTGCFILVNTGEEIIKSKNKLISTIGYKINDSISYALEGSIFISGAIVQWLRDGLQIIKSAEETEYMASELEDNQGLYMVPALTGLGAPYWSPDARGAIYGITRDTSPKHFVRAALESVAYQTHDLLEAIQSDGIKIGIVKVDGGMVNNEWLMQFLANILNKKIRRPVVTETTAYGAALLTYFYSQGLSDIGELENFWKLDKEYIPCFKDNVRKKYIKEWKRAIHKTLDIK